MRSKRAQPRTRGANTDVLNVQQQMFIKHLLASTDFNVALAARQAGYKAKSIGNRLMKNKVVLAAIGKAIKDRGDKLDWGAEDVLLQLKTTLTLSPKDVFERQADGSYVVKPLDEIPDDVSRCIAEIENTYKEVNGELVPYVKLRFMSKDIALGLAMKHFGMLNDKLVKEHEVGPNLGNVLQDLVSAVEQRNNVIDAKVIAHLSDDGVRVNTNGNGKSEVER